MEYADVIREIRKICSLSQEELAKELGVSFASVNRWERKRTQPSKMAIQSIFVFCQNKGLDYLLKGGAVNADS